MTIGVFVGTNGRPIAIDLDKIEALIDESDEHRFEVHIFTSADWYKVRETFVDVLKLWREHKAD